MARQSKFLGFVERLPQVHQLTLTYLIGFLQEIVQNAAYTCMERADIGAIFGPCIVNPSRIAGTTGAKVQELTTQAVAFCTRLLEPREAAIIYPLNPAYLPEAEPPKRPGAEPPQADPGPGVFPGVSAAPLPGQEVAPPAPTPQLAPGETPGEKGEERGEPEAQGYYDENGQWQPGYYDETGTWHNGYWDENGQWQSGYYD
jgi:hypothetical protein